MAKGHKYVKQSCHCGQEVSKSQWYRHINKCAWYKLNLLTTEMDKLLPNTLDTKSRLVDMKASLDKLNTSSVDTVSLTWAYTTLTKLLDIRKEIETVELP